MKKCQNSRLEFEKEKAKGKLDELKAANKDYEKQNITSQNDYKGLSELIDEYMAKEDLKQQLLEKDPVFYEREQKIKQAIAAESELLESQLDT